MIAVSVDGVPWFAAPPPLLRWHRCWPQTVYRMVPHPEALDGLTTVERCPCGGWRVPGQGWADKNSQRASRKAGHNLY